MRLEERYELLKEVKRLGEEDLLIPVWERANHRLACVHILAGGYSDENNAMLKVIAGLAPEHRERIVGAGDHLGHPYVTTLELPTGVSLRRWVAFLRAEKRKPEDSPQSP